MGLCLLHASPAWASESSSSSISSSSLGPLTIRSLAPIFPNRLSYTPGRVLPLQPGQIEAMALVSHANIWAQMPGYFFDGEWTRLALRGAYGVACGWEVGAEVALYQRMGGFMDGFIMGFHRLFHVTQARRDRYPRNRLRVDMIDATGTHPQLTEANAGWGLGNPTLAVKKQLSPGWVAEALLKLPVGSIQNQFATPNFALALDVAVSQSLGAHFWLDAAFGLVMSPGEQQVYGLQLALLQKFLSVAVQWRPLASLAVVAQYLNQDGIAESCAARPLNQTTHEFALGIKVAPSGNERLLIEAALLENSVHDANTPDFGMPPRSPMAVLTSTARVHCDRSAEA